jgi:hypothetical protein
MNSYPHGVLRGIKQERQSGLYLIEESGKEVETLRKLAYDIFA